MCKKNVTVTFILVLSVALGLSFRSWAKTDLPLPNEILTDIVSHPGDPSKLLAVSDKELYLRGEKKNWKRILRVQGKSVSIQQLITYPGMQDKVFLLTGEGVLEGDLKNGRTSWLFREMNKDKNQIYALALNPENPKQLYLGTERGLFQSHDGGRSWKGPFRWPENQRVEFVGYLPSQPPLLLIGTNRELFVSKNEGNSFESGFSLPLYIQEEGDENQVVSEATPRPCRFTSLAFSLNEPTRLWVGTLEGVFESHDGGISWEKLSDAGLENRQILDIVFSEKLKMLIAATPRGVFRFHSDAKHWEKIPIGLTRAPTSIALQAVSENSELLFVASGNEIFEWILKPEEIPDSESIFFPSPERVRLFRKLITLEPTIREIQKAATRYGNLGNGKINRWHQGSRLRAFIPKLGFGKKFSVGNNIDIDRGGTNNPDVFISGPNKVDRGWDLGLTWELGDFLYSTAQPAIDSRAKLLVELRESILSEVTRIYFERRRLQNEIILFPPQGMQERMDLLLRLDELTAQLDALTDGFLSRKLDQMTTDEPALKELFS